MILDTDVLIDLLRKVPAAEKWLKSLPAWSAVSGFACAEMYFGCLNARELRQARVFVAPFPVLWPTNRQLASVLQLYPELHLSSGIGLMDALVAESALSNSLPLVTFNVKHFKNVPGLRIVRPYARP